MFDLPSELISLIFSYDGTYKEIYDNIIKEISNYPKFVEYYDVTEREIYVFYFNKTKKKKVFYYITNYKDRNHYPSYLSSFQASIQYNF